MASTQAALKSRFERAQRQIEKWRGRHVWKSTRHYPDGRVEVEYLDCKDT